jgi:hypothetical protein
VEGAGSDEDKQIVASENRNLRTPFGSSVRQCNNNSSDNSQEESDDGTQQDGGSNIGAEGSSKSVSLLEWSKFEESAAKLTVGVEDEQIIATANRNLRDGDDSRHCVLPCNGAKVREGGTEFESSEVEKSARVTASEVVKKVLAGSSITDKLQEKLLRLGRSSEDYKDNEETTPDAISETTSEEQEASAEMDKKTEECSENSEDCEMSSVSAKESDAVKNLNLEMLSERTRKPRDDDAERDSIVCASSSSEQKRDRSESAVVNKTPLKAELRHYGKRYSPKVVLYNLVLPPGKLLQEKARSVTNEIVSDQKPHSREEKCPLLPAEPKKAQERVGKSKVSSNYINVNELRRSVNLSKDISLTVVGAGCGGHSISAKDMSSGSVTPLEMESDHDDSHNSSMNATSASVPVTAQNAVMGENSINKQKKQKSSVGNNSLQARSRARKSFPNRPVIPNVKVKSHPELDNGVGAFSNKSSVVRRSSVGTNSNSSDSRRSSYGTSPQEMLITAQQLGDAGGSDNNNNNPGSAMVVLPHALGNPTTNHIQALRTVNNNIGAPSHIANSGPDMMPSRMMQGPHNQPHSVGNGTRISPAGQGPGAAAGASRMPPQLQPRPPGPLLSQHPPSVPLEAGPVSAELNRHAHKVLNCCFVYYYFIRPHDLIVL